MTSNAEAMAAYYYDQRSQLTGVVHHLYPSEWFSYDDSGNRQGTGNVTSADNRTTTADGWTYTYDDEGNMTSAAGHGLYKTFTWDHRNRLVRVTYGTSSTVDYEYDPYNRLTKAGELNWVYDTGINPVLQFGGGPRQVYLWSDAVDDLLAAERVVEGNVPGNILWPLADHLGSIRDIADCNDTTGVTSVVNHRRYDSFGQLKSETNAAVDLIFGYTGKLFDEATGLQNNHNRWYNPGLGKFISQDPIGFAGGDTNLYRYVGNRVTSHVDPLGLEETGVINQVAQGAIEVGTAPFNDALETQNVIGSAYSGARCKFESRLNNPNRTNFQKFFDRIGLGITFAAEPLSRGAAGFTDIVNILGVPKRRAVGAIGANAVESFAERAVQCPPVKGLASTADGPAMDPGRFARMKAAFERNPKRSIDTSPQAQMDMFEMGGPGQTGLTLSADDVLMRPNPSASTFFDEMIHTSQFRHGRVDRAYSLYGRQVGIDVLEFEVQRKLLKDATAYGITDVERAAIKVRALEIYRRLQSSGNGTVREMLDAIQ